MGTKNRACRLSHSGSEISHPPHCRRQRQPLSLSFALSISLSLSPLFAHLCVCVGENVANVLSQLYPPRDLHDLHRRSRRRPAIRTLSLRLPFPPSLCIPVLSLFPPPQALLCTHTSHVMYSQAPGQRTSTARTVENRCRAPSSDHTRPTRSQHTLT